MRYTTRSGKIVLLFSPAIRSLPSVGFSFLPSAQWFPDPPAFLQRPWSPAFLLGNAPEDLYKQDGWFFPMQIDLTDWSHRASFPRSLLFRLSLFSLHSLYNSGSRSAGTGLLSHFPVLLMLLNLPGVPLSYTLPGSFRQKFRKSVSV